MVSPQTAADGTHEATNLCRLTLPSHTSIINTRKGKSVPLARIPERIRLWTIIGSEFFTATLQYQLQIPLNTTVLPRIPIERNGLRIHRSCQAIVGCRLHRCQPEITQKTKDEAPLMPPHHAPLTMPMHAEGPSPESPIPHRQVWPSWLGRSQLPNRATECQLPIRSMLIRIFSSPDPHECLTPHFRDCGVGSSTNARVRSDAGFTSSYSSPSTITSPRITDHKYKKYNAYPKIFMKSISTS
jgi:hypothetical protein